MFDPKKNMDCERVCGCLIHSLINPGLKGAGKRGRSSIAWREKNQIRCAQCRVPKCKGVSVDRYSAKVSSVVTLSPIEMFPIVPLIRRIGGRQLP